jgi:hypothetical protein
MSPQFRTFSSAKKLKSKIAGFLLRALPQTEDTLTAGDP